MTARVLVLGTGQLSMMLAEAGVRLGVIVDRLSPETGELFPGTSDLVMHLDTDALLSRYTAITVERDTMPDNELVATLLASPKAAISRTMAVLPDRLTQKQLLDELGIATSPWLPGTELAQARAQWGNVVIKARRGGYDGRGTHFLSADDAQPDADEDTIVEATIGFRRELSLLAARSSNGEMAFYPLVENIHRDGILNVTRAPAQQLHPQHQAQAEAMARALLEKLDYHGIMAIELFDCGDQLLVNEISPRVHNSGHWSQEGASISQFEMHLRALTGLPLTPPEVKGFAAMLNLLGVAYDTEWLHRPGYVHWYAKDVRPGRKMGHVNFITQDADTLEEQMLAWRDVARS